MWKHPLLPEHGSTWFAWCASSHDVSLESQYQQYRARGKERMASVFLVVMSVLTFAQVPFFDLEDPVQVFRLGCTLLIYFYICMMRCFFHLLPSLTFHWDHLVTVGAAIMIVSFALSYDRVTKILGEPEPEKSCEYEISSQVCIAAVLLGVGLLLKIRWQYFAALALLAPVCYASFGSILGCLGCDSGGVSILTGTLQLAGLGVLTLIGVVLHESDRRRLWESWCDAETLMTRLQTAHSLRERLLRAVFDVSFAAELEPESGDLRVVGEWPALDSFLGMPMKDAKLSGYLPGVDTARFFEYVRGAVVATDEAIPACLLQVSFETASGCSVPANMYVVSAAFDPVLTVCLSTKILADEEFSGHHRSLQPYLGTDLSAAVQSRMQNLLAEAKTPLERPPQAPPSLHSAPTELLRAASPRVLSTCEACDDCLRPDSMAWVEGLPLPQPLTSLQAGQKILCHDSLSKGLKYAEILSLRMEIGATDWVTVSLEDGTSLEMTANHPVQPLLGKGPPGAVRAKDLRPGNDHLMVLKTLPMLVQEVSTASKIEPEKRMFLTLRQPERHSPFIASAAADSRTPSAIHTIAVGSADAPSREYDLTLKNTFIDIVDCENAQPVLKRSNSAPPGCLNIKVATTISTKSVSSCRSTPSESSFDANIMLAPPTQPFTSVEGKNVVLGWQSRPTAAEISLSEVLAIRSARMSSLGAAGHSQGQCRACLFSSRAAHHGGSMCWKGVFCERCHEPHDPVPRKKAKTGRQREYDKRRQALANGEAYRKPHALLEL